MGNTEKIENPELTVKRRASLKDDINIVSMRLLDLAFKMEQGIAISCVQSFGPCS